MTLCGVGICGSCADDKGRRTCVEGPFMDAKNMICAGYSQSGFHNRLTC